MTRLILVRHGETQKNAEGKTHTLSDPENLTPNGIRQIELAATALAKFQPDKLYCSGEVRANESAEIIANKLSLPLTKIYGLEERNWGDYAGLPFSEIKEKLNLETMTFEKRYTFSPPNGESWKKAETRLLKTIDKIISENKGKTVVIVTHGGSIRILMPTLLSMGKEESYKYDPDNASISIFDYDSKKFSKIIYNDTSHLKD